MSLLCRWFPVRTLLVAPLWCDLGLFPNSRGNKAVANLRPKMLSNTDVIIHTTITLMSCYILPVWGMSIRNFTTPGSNLASVTDLKKNSNPHILCCAFGGVYISLARRQSSSLSQVQAPASHLAISPKAVPAGNGRFRGQNQRPSSWGHSPALLGRVGRAGTNTGRFRVCCSRCRPRLARLRKKCYHSCETDSVQESKRI